MSGGLGFSPATDNLVTITRDAKEFENLPPLPLVPGYHCIAAIDENKLFVTGLGGNEDGTFIYSKDTGDWSNVPDMPRKRTSPACGVVRDGDGKSEVVVVGSTEWGSGMGHVVDIFSVEEETWRTASNRFPIDITAAAVAQVEDTF